MWCLNLSAEGNMPKSSPFSSEDKQKAIDKITKMLKAKTVEERKLVVGATGEKSFTLEDMLKEVEEETKYGTLLIQIMSSSKSEFLKNEEK